MIKTKTVTKNAHIPLSEAKGYQIGQYSGKSRQISGKSSKKYLIPKTPFRKSCKSFLPPYAKRSTTKAFAKVSLVPLTFRAGVVF